MARKHPSQTLAPTPLVLRARVNGALSEGRVPQALELAKKLVAQAPTDEHHELLRRVYLDGIRYQIGRESAGDARRWLDEAERVDGPAPTWWESLALLRATIGDCDRARKLLEKAPGSAMLRRVVGFQVDRAMSDRQRGRDFIPGDLRPEFDLIRKAFAEYEQGQDEAVRQTLQNIGLQSPYLDWKLLLRGLLAWSANDDARALENWQRLDAERLPAKMAAPFRIIIEPAYRNSLPSEEAKRIARRADQIGHPLANSMRELQKSLGTPETLSRAFNQAPAVLGMLRTNFPHLAPKLANCFYWLIVQGGEPKDLERFEKLFGKPPDDPEFFRLRAELMEMINGLDKAHQFWKEYADWIEATPERWPGNQGQRARAMISLRMGDNAQRHLEGNDGPSFDDIFDMLSRGAFAGGNRKPLQPSAEACYRRAMELAPDWKEPAVRLMALLEEAENWEGAEAIGSKLLKQFPDDVPTLIRVSSIQQTLGKTDEALAHLKDALKANPLDRQLRGGVAALTLEQGRTLASLKQYDEARQAFREAAAHDDGIILSIAKAAEAACEFKAKNPERANQLAAEAGIRPSHVPGSIYEVLVECIRVKVDKKILQQQQARFDEMLSGERTISELINLVVTFAFYQHEPRRYRGIGPHEKKIMARVEKTIRSDISEEDLAQLGLVLWKHNLSKILKICAEQGMSLYRDNATFPFLLAEHLIMQRPQSFNSRQVCKLFGDVLGMTEGKQDERSRMLRDKIEERKKQEPEIDDWMTPYDDDDDDFW